MERPPGFNSAPSDEESQAYPPSSGHVRLPYASIGPLPPPPPPPTNFHPGLHLPPQQGAGVVNMNGPTLAAMNGAVPTAPLLTVPAPSVPSFYLPNDDPFPSAVVYGPAQPVRVMTDASVPFDPSTPPPFADRAQLQLPRPHGVLKIMNIPYTISISEMQQFICKYIPQSHLIEPHVAGYPIHIIMERSTGKTMDCYVEIVAPLTAAQDWEHAFGLTRMRIPKIGQRNVEVSLSNQGELMKDMFPRAKCIHFDGEQFGAPRLVPNRDIFSSGYKGFMTNEELTCMVRHAEYPQRSQFANRSMQRTFESMISTLYKFPWFSVKLYTVRQTVAIFDAYKKQLDALVVKVDSSRGIPREVGLDNKLMMDFVFAGLNAPGFSERQRADIVESSQALACGFSISKHARYWPFQTLSVHPPNLSDQDVGMWFEILNIGMGVMESQNHKLIGIEPYLEVFRDTEGHVLFMPTETGLGLKRGQFSMLEKRFMNEMIQLGWNTYMGHMGVESAPQLHHPGVHHFNNDYLVGAAHVNPVDPFTAARSTNNRSGGPLNYNGQGSGTGAYTTNHQTGQRQYPDGSSGIDNFDDENDFGGEEHGDNFDDPEKAEKAMREVLRQVSEAPPPKQKATTKKISEYDAEIEGLGAGLQNIELSSSNNGPGPTIVGQLPQQRTARAGTVRGHPFNPESPAFEPPQGWTQQHRHTPSNSGSNLGAGSAFGGSGLGNGDFTSPQRISTARTNNKGKGKEPAAANTTASATAAGIRLQPAAPIFGPPLGVAFGRFDAAQANTFQVPSRDRRGVTIRSPDDGTTFTTLRPPSAVEIGGTTGDGSNPFTLSPGRARNINGADGIDEFLDDLFGETTTHADRMAMQTPVMTPSSTPPTAPVTPLRRTIARVPSAGIGPFEDDYEDGEVVSMPAISRLSPSQTRISHTSSNLIIMESGAPNDRGFGSGWEGYELLSQDDSPVRSSRDVMGRGFGATLAGSPYPQRMTILESTPDERSYRQALQRAQLHIHETIDEEQES